MGALNTLKQAWIKRDALGDKNQDRVLAQFLPAALEIQATPPHPLARWLGVSLIVLTLIGVVWACLGQVNIVASAEGKIIPSSQVKKIQPLEKAIVKRILVKEGQHVQQGDALIELDNTLTYADQTRVSVELNTLQRNLSVSQSFVQLLEQPAEQQKNIHYEHLSLVNDRDDGLYKQLLWQQWKLYWSQNQSLQQSLNRVKAEQAASREQIKKFKQVLPITVRRVEKIKILLDKNYASEDEYLTLKQERIEQFQDLKAEQQKLRQLLASEEEIEQQRKNSNAQMQTQHLTLITEYQQKIASLNEELKKAKDVNKKQILYAPASGQIQDLAVSTVGGVVTEAQQLMLIVPDEEQLEVEVFLENKDIGFVNEGMSAEIKIHTFPFTKYGIVDGEITTVSDDATLDEQRGLIYKMRLLMKKSTMNIDGKEVNLIPGMSVTAEMQTGHRRIIEFFLAPLIRYRQEGLRER